MPRTGGLRAIALAIAVGLSFAGCGDEPAGPADMSASLTTCSELCGRYLTCVQMANPSFKGTMNALVPCENQCFAATEQVRSDLRACYTRSCSDFVACAMQAKLTLQQQPTPDAGIDLGTVVDLSSQD